ncbi:histone acetyltransferase p300-like isoform X2 [Chironomus tepperi]|uniref:histone acetyltransferase p300-like isoform X2 n=1 Tax=Chironomus tepperi TaxID=113505 RepID=UPI00391EEECB
MSIYKLAIDCKEQFDWKIDRFMKSRGYCCGIWHTRKSKKVQCSGTSKCIVKPNSAYFRYNSWAFCEKCLHKLPIKDIKLDDNVHVNKADLKICFYIDEEPEDFVECLKCKKLLHERCVLHIKQSGIPFYCQKCRSREPALKTINISSEQIPKTKCDIYIENFLKEHNVPNCDDIVVRLVSNVPTNFYTKPVIAKYHNKNYGHEISYNNCVIFVFLKLNDGTEICFFGVYFQLYGNSKCPEPNKNSVYLSYIDSVKLCIVKERTKIYQIVLLGLFKYLKMKNFRRVFIWSCPPKRDIDYIFHEKPSDMKMPTKARLGDWYQKLMKLAVDEHIAESFEGIKKFADDENWDDINNIPYMDSDMWPIRLEEAIIAAEYDTKKSTTEIRMKIKELMEVQKIGFDNQYFVLHLSSNSTIINAELPKAIKGNWINNRSDLVDMFWEKKLEYSNERLAKFSTKVLLYRIFVDDSICLLCGKYSNEGVNLFLLCRSCVEGNWMQNKKHPEVKLIFNSNQHVKMLS